MKPIKVCAHGNLFQIYVSFSAAFLLLSVIKNIKNGWGYLYFDRFDFLLSQKCFLAKNCFSWWTVVTKHFFFLPLEIFPWPKIFFLVVRKKLPATRKKLPATRKKFLRQNKKKRIFTVSRKIFLASEIISVGIQIKKLPLRNCLRTHFWTQINNGKNKKSCEMFLKECKFNNYI